MSVLFILVLASLCVAGCFLAAFIWSVKHDQFEDQKGASLRILFEEKSIEKAKPFSGS